MKSILLATLIVASTTPALATIDDDERPTLGGSVHVAVQDDEPTGLNGALHVLFALIGPAVIGGELSGRFGSTDKKNCPADRGDPDAPRASISRVCFAPSIDALALVGVEWGDGVSVRALAGAGPAWRVFTYGGDRSESGWSLSWMGRGMVLLQAGEALGGRWRVGVSLEGTGYDTDRPVFGGGLIFEATIID